MTGRKCTLPSAGSPGEVCSCLPPGSNPPRPRDGAYAPLSLGTLGRGRTPPPHIGKTHPPTPDPPPPPPPPPPLFVSPPPPPRAGTPRGRGTGLTRLSLWGPWGEGLQPPP